MAESCFNQDELIEEFFLVLMNKVSIDQKVISLNALQLFSRKEGLRTAIRELFQETTHRLRKSNYIRLNDEIVSELSDVKAMLDQKSK